MSPMLSMARYLNKQVQSWRCSRRLIFITAVFTLSLLVCVYPLAPLLFHPPTYWLTPCKLHQLDPWDPSLRQYLRPAPSVVCANGSNVVYVNATGFLVMNDSAVDQYSIVSMACTYQIVTRHGDFDVRFGDPVAFTPPAFVHDRVFRVTCVDSAAQPVYDFIHYNIFWNESSARECAIGQETDDQLSVVFIGLDSASRSHALRNLPQSYKYLTETLGAFDFRGYMKVGRNSFPNVVPLLTGTEGTENKMRMALATNLDNLRFIWREPGLAGYASLQTEDRPDISTFNFIVRGFSRPPTDYYFRPISLAMEQIEPIITAPLGKMSWHCYGNKDHFSDTQIGFLKDFMVKYKTRLKFAFLWNNQIGHEDFLSLGRGDKPLLDLLTWMHDGGHLTRTLLIVGSDHGFRLGGPSTTYVGRLENNMPFLSIYLPPQLRSRYPWLDENLRFNTGQLTTPYDVYQTMLDVAYRRFGNVPQADVSKYRVRRSLLTKIPETRTCLDAGVPAQYCTCYDAVQVNTSDNLIKEFANFAVAEMNNKLKSTDACHELLLQNVTDAKVFYTVEGDSDNSHIHRGGWFLTRLFQEDDMSGRYTIVFCTGPNHGQFEAMIEYAQRTVDGGVHQMTMLGEPVRIDRYGNQSYCVDDGDLKQFCLCKDVVL